MSRKKYSFSDRLRIVNAGCNLDGGDLEPFLTAEGISSATYYRWRSDPKIVARRDKDAAALSKCVVDFDEPQVKITEAQRLTLILTAVPIS